MTEFTRFSATDGMLEYQRLLAAQARAHQAHDDEAVEAADDEMRHFLRMNATGRLQEYFASRQAVSE